MRDAIRLLCLLLPLAACTIAPSELPRLDGDVVHVKCCRIPDKFPWVARFATHAWVDLRLDGVWHRVEVMPYGPEVWDRQVPETAVFADNRWNHPVHVVAFFDEAADASRIGAAVLRAVERYPYEGHYRAWPGPNSNTFVEWLSHEIRGFAFELHPTAVGKDWAGWGSARTSSTRTGIELETAALGVQVGLREGVELHLLGLTFGVGLWPPRLKLPFLPALPFGLRSD
ncbi:MAG: DUF3750 domain-containing protein [Planctomycetes bacterium]|nr:DUF3750 domain-containing protein [Planctomycetota bacterium]